MCRASGPAPAFQSQGLNQSQSLMDMCHPPIMRHQPLDSHIPIDLNPGGLLRMEAARLKRLGYGQGLKGKDLQEFLERMAT